MTSLLLDSTYDVTTEPVIAVLAQPWVEAVKDANGKTIDYQQNSFFPTRQYIAASYVKFVESAGGRCIPLSFFSTREEAYDLLSKCNGLLLPGGDGNFPAQIEMLLDIAVELNENGYFPVWGTCLGFQYIATYFGRKNGWRPNVERSENNFNFLDNIPVHNQSNALEFTQDGRDQSIWLRDMPKSLQDAFENEPLTANFHNYGVTVDNYTKYLVDDFILVSTANADLVISIDDEHDVKQRLATGDVIKPHPTDDTKLIWQRHHITQLEHRTFPIFAVQYHPERTLYEWGVNGDSSQFQKISRSRAAILGSQYSATFFVFACRQCPHQFESLAELNSKLIYHYPKEAFGRGIVEMYFFNHWYPKQTQQAKTIITPTSDGNNSNSQTTTPTAAKQLQSPKEESLLAPMG